MPKLDFFLFLLGLGKIVIFGYPVSGRIVGILKTDIRYPAGLCFIYQEKK